MKQLIFMILMTLAGTVGVFLYNPFWGVAIYYLFAVLRPQFLWEWALRSYIKIDESSWSFYVAIATIVAAFSQRFRLIAISRAPKVEKHPPVPLNTAHFLVFMFGVWVTMAYLLADDQTLAHPWFVEYVKIFVMFFVSTRLIWSVRQLWALLVISALSLGYIAYEVNFIYLQTRRVTIWHSGFGGLDNNGAGLMLAMGVPLCLFVWEGSRRWWRWVFASFIPVLIHAVLMSFSRGAMVALLIAAPLFIIRSRYRFYLAIAFAAVALVLPFMAGAEIQSRFFSIEQFDKDGSAQSRLGSWKAAMAIAMLNPINGVGLRNAGLYVKMYGADFEGRTIHSQYLQLAADTGFVGVGIYCGILLAVVWNTRRTRYRLQFREDPEAIQACAVASGVECSLAVFAIGALFLSLELFELPYLMMLMGAQVSAVLDSQETQRGPMFMAPRSLPQHLTRAAAS